MTRKIALTLLSFTIMFISCGQEQRPENSTTILCVTSDATAITQTSAVLNGTASIKDAKANNANAFFYYSTTSGDAKTIKASGQRVSAGSIPNSGENFNYNLGSLSPSTTYYFVASVMIDDVEELGGIKSFTTEKKSEAISVTGTALNVTVNSATLTSYANLTADMTGDVTIGIIYSTNSSPSLQNGKLLTSKDLDGNNMYQVEATDLTPDTKYYFKSFLSRSNLNYYGDVKEFSTAQVLASVSTLDAWDVAETKASIGGKVEVSSAGVVKREAAIYYGADGSNIEALKNKGKRVGVDGISEDGLFTTTISGLNAETKYYYVAVVLVEGVEFCGTIKNFTTADKPASVSVTGEYSDLGESSVKLYGWCNQDGAEGTSVVYGVEYSCTDLTTAAVSLKASEKDSENKFCCQATGLSSNTLYYYRAFVLFNGVRTYGEVKSFTTKSFSAQTTSLAATNITEFKATLNGELKVDSVDELNKDVWFLYSESASTLDDLKANGQRAYSSLNQDGSFGSSLSSLNYNTTYHYVACSRVHDAEYYGEVRSFTTLDFSARVTSAAATDITEFHATLNGTMTVVSEESLDKSVWFLYSDSATDLESLKTNGTKVTSSLQEDGSFMCSIPQQSYYYYEQPKLNYNTTYYYVACSRVYDRDVYGEVKSFKTSDFSATISSHSENVEKTRATISGILSIASKENLSMSAKIYYGTKTSTADDLVANGKMMQIGLGQNGEFSCQLSSLSNGSKYFFLIVATVHDKQFVSSVQTFTTLTPNCPEGAVNLGLSVCWATYNVGASSIYDYGSLYSWGETSAKDYLPNRDNWGSYKWCNGTKTSLTKYNYNSAYGDVDNKSVLELTDDAAYIINGNQWRMPTAEECEELSKGCSVSLKEINGTTVLVFTSLREGYTDQFITFPYGYDDRDYWTATLQSTGHQTTPDYAQVMRVNENEGVRLGVYGAMRGRCCPRQIRPVAR